MGKPKKHYAIYYEGKGIGCYSEKYKKTYLGDTWAISEKQACNYVRFRFRNEERPHGGYSSDILGDYLDEGEGFFTYKAYEMKD